MTFRFIDRSNEPRPRWEIRAIDWLARRLRDDGGLKLRLGHSLALLSQAPELYLQVVHGKDEVVVFDMCFEPAQWYLITQGMARIQYKLEQEYEEVNNDD